MRSLARGATWVVGLGLVTACTGAPVVEGAEGGGVSAIQFADIPVPDGMVLLQGRHESDSRVDGKYRYANFTYSGTLPPTVISAYLLERMPQHSWRLVEHQSDSEGVERLRFVRGSYVAECDVQAMDAMTRMEIRVRTSLENEKQ